jgi:hypothetical protein
LGRRFKRVVFAWGGPGGGAARDTQERAAAMRLADLEPLSARLAALLRDHLFRLDPAVETLVLRLTPTPAETPALTETDPRGRGPVLTVDLAAAADEVAALPQAAAPCGEFAIAYLERAIAALAATPGLSATMPAEVLARALAQHRAEGHGWSWSTGNAMLGDSRVRARLDARADASATALSLALIHRGQTIGGEEVWRTPGARIEEASGWREIRRIGTRLILRHQSPYRHPDIVVDLARFPEVAARLVEGG